MDATRSEPYLTEEEHVMAAVAYFEEWLEKARGFMPPDLQKNAEDACLYAKTASHVLILVDLVADTYVHYFKEKDNAV